jgi:esterase/lipase superfamily enzyme
VKIKTGWYSERLRSDVNVVRWGEVGAPVFIFPTAGGDAEEIERMLIIDALGPLLHEGRIKVYSCDSVAGAAMLSKEGDPNYRMALLNAFHQCVYHEIVPAIRADCHLPDVGVISAGSSIGAFNAVAVLCRYPDVFTHAIGMSGTYDLEPFLEAQATDDLYYASPLHFLPGLGGDALDMLRRRYVILPSGEGSEENIGESWRMADQLGRKGIPNRVDSWGPDWHHRWPTWRVMLPRYLDEIVPR